MNISTKLLLRSVPMLLGVLLFAVGGCSEAPTSTLVAYPEPVTDGTNVTYRYVQIDSNENEIPGSDTILEYHVVHLDSLYGRADVWSYRSSLDTVTFSQEGDTAAWIYQPGMSFSGIGVGGRWMYLPMAPGVKPIPVRMDTSFAIGPYAVTFSGEALGQYLGKWPATVDGFDIDAQRSSVDGEGSASAVLGTVGTLSLKSQASIVPDLHLLVDMDQRLAMAAALLGVDQRQHSKIELQTIQRPGA